jgi:hypothetical protein
MRVAATEPEFVATLPPSYDYPEPYPRALITIHDRVWPGFLRRRSWSDELQDWRWSVEVCIDDRRVMTWVSADQIEIVEPGEGNGPRLVG